MVRYIFYIFHILGILISFISLFWYKEILVLHTLVIISWYFNNNKCILTQLEDYFFGETIIDVYFSLINKKKKYNKYIVPRYQRYSLYTTFIIGIIYHYVF